MKTIVFLILFCAFPQLCAKNEVQNLARLLEKIATSRFAVTVGGIAGFGLPMIDLAKLLIEPFREPEPDKMEIGFDEMKSKLNKIQEEVLDFKGTFGIQIDSTTNQHFLATKYETFVHYYWKITTQIEYFYKEVLKYRNSSEFPEKLKHFVEKYKAEMFETMLVRLAIGDTTLQNSLISVYHNFLLSEEDYTIERKGDQINFHAFSSTQLLIYNFYLKVMSKVAEGEAMVNTCHYLLNESSGEENQISSNPSSLMAELQTSMEDAVKRVEALHHRYSFFSFTSPVREVRMQKVLQFYWQNERKIMPNMKTCEGCEGINKNQNYTSDDCIGSVRNCALQNIAIVNKQLTLHPVSVSYFLTFPTNITSQL